jgi:hypothetical protein
MFDFVRALEGFFYPRAPYVTSAVPCLFFASTGPHLGAVATPTRRSGLERHGYPWVPTNQGLNCPRQVGSTYLKTRQPVSEPYPTWHMGPRTWKQLGVQVKTVHTKRRVSLSGGPNLSKPSCSSPFLPCSEFHTWITTYALSSWSPPLTWSPPCRSIQVLPPDIRGSHNDQDEICSLMFLSNLQV